ncbi:MAG: type VI secretion protein, partial [Pseudoxanthomonas suwonensis]
MCLKELGKEPPAVLAGLLLPLMQGCRIVTGQGKDSMAILMVNAAKAAFIVSAATSMAVLGVQVHTFVTENLRLEISGVVTGSATLPEKQIDKNLALMSVALGSIDVLDVASDPVLDQAKTRALWFSGIGMGGPALAGGSLLLMYEVALALFIGLGPIFILMLLFDATKQMFHKWLWFGIGTLFSLAVLNAMVTLSLDAVLAVAGAFWVGEFIGSSSEGVTSVALQQGGLGLILSTLILGAPPMAAL